MGEQAQCIDVVHVPVGCTVGYVDWVGWIVGFDAGYLFGG
jgi:hypothetical protein